MFLLAMQAPLHDDARYEFEPYSYGPMSRELYGDVRRLAREQLLDAAPVAGATWRLLQLSGSGFEHAERLRETAELAHPKAVAELLAIRGEISALSFSQLLANVYDRYPEYAVRSVFRRPR